MGATEDDNIAQPGPQTAIAEPDDAVADADDVRHPHFIFPEWSGPLLGRLQSHQHSHAVLCYRLGWSASGEDWQSGSRKEKYRAGGSA